MNILNMKHQKYINLTKSFFSSIYQPFFPNVPFSLLISLKKSESLWFSDVFRGSNGNIGKNWVKIILFNTVKPLNSGQSLSVIERCLPLGGI